MSLEHMILKLDIKWMRGHLELYIRVLFTKVFTAILIPVIHLNEIGFCWL